MLKRSRISTRVRGLMVAGIVVLNAGVSAIAGVAAPTAHVVDGANTCTPATTQCDGWLNKAEVNAGIIVSGTYTTSATPPVDHIRVFVVNQDTHTATDTSGCDIGSSQVARPGMPGSSTPGNYITISRPTAIDYDPTKGTINADGTWTAGPFDITLLSEGAHVCARARASDDGGVSFTELAVSDNSPVKDTIVLPGTLSLTDPNADGFVNVAEFGDPAQVPPIPSSVNMVWTSSGADAATAAISVRNFAGVTPLAECGPYALAGSGSQPLSNVCLSQLDGSSARLFPNYQSFSLAAVWSDAAGNTTAVVPSSNSLIRDTDPPVAPTVTFGIPAGTPAVCNDAPCLNKANIKTVKFSGDLGLSDDTDPFTGHVSESHLEGLGTKIAISVTDGTTTLNGLATRSSLTASPHYTTTMDLSALKECPDITAGCVTAKAFVIDLAGNTGPSADATPCLNPHTAITCAVAKDTTAPTMPTVNINPNPITVINQGFVEFNVCGETGTSVTLTVDDDNAPDTTAITYPLFNLSSCRTVNFDVTTLRDGLITATAVLADKFGNKSLPGIGTALKKVFASPAVTIDSPSAGALVGKTVKVQGTALVSTSGPSTTVNLFDSYVDLAGQPHDKVQLNGKPIPVNPNASWELTVVFPGSGTHTLEAVTSYAAAGHSPRASLTFDVDAVNPDTALTAPIDRQVYQPGEPIIFSGDASDDFSGVYGVQVQIFDITKQTGVQVGLNPPSVTLQQNRTIVDTAASCPLCAFKMKKAAWSFNASSLPLGVYKALIYAVDYRNNHSTQPTPVTFVRL